MRILQIVTLVSPDAAFGGPTSVAVNQSKALQAMGHDVVITAGVTGFANAPRNLDGVPFEPFRAYRILPAMGFSSLVSPKLLQFLNQSKGTFDIVHVHLGRDLVSMLAARMLSLSKKTYVVQTHGMISAQPKRRILAFLFDRLLTRKVLLRASLVFHLTETERNDLSTLCVPDASLKQLRNGVPVATQVSTLTERRVLYLARLHPRKRPMHFVDVATVLEADFPQWRFVLVGPDGGEGEAVTQAILERGLRRTTWYGAKAPRDVLTEFETSSIYVLPSMDEPFPMTVLEAMSAGLPVVIGETCGLRGPVEASGAGIVVAAGASFESALRRLMVSAKMREAMGRRARALVHEEFSMQAVAHQLEQDYQELL